MQQTVIVYYLFLMSHDEEMQQKFTVYSFSSATVHHRYHRNDIKDQRLLNLYKINLQKNPRNLNRIISKENYFVLLQVSISCYFHSLIKEYWA